MALRSLWIFCAALAVCTAMCAAPASTAETSAGAGARHTFTIGEREFLLDGKPFLIRCGEIHFARVPREYWRHRLKMCRAMGLNAVCVYLFWNLHEWREGRYDWSGQADAAEFCRLAQEEGLWVLLRPGPYSCAEWEMGGLPWWLLKNDEVKLRTSDPAFMEPAKRYLKEVGRVLAPTQITRGGPLLMVQVENEYGSYGNDPEYMGQLRQALLEGGFDVPLFACNPPGAIKNGFREDLFQVVNFGRGAKQAFETLRKFQKTGPLMNGEYYPGWFDTWGRKHRTGTVDQALSDLEYMLSNGMSFSIYMAHGGTSFGFWSGADRPFLPDTSSYDYDAPISEAGWATEKFTRIRELFAKHLLPGETLTEPPPANPVIAIPAFALTQVAPLLENLPAAPLQEERPRAIELFDHSRGCTVYRTTLPAGPAGVLTAKAVHDFGWVMLDGKTAGVMDRRGRRFRLELPARERPVQLDFVVESVGRVNFGKEIFDRKGLHAPVAFAARGGEAAELKNWTVFPLPLDEAQLAGLRFRQTEPAAAGPAFWRATFDVAQPGDTFLDLRAWGKGVVWVNGHCLGRFWNIGPTQTMYCPGPWLKAGRNDVVVLDLIGPTEARLAGLALPILDQLRPELDFARVVRARGQFSIESATLAAEGSFTPEIQWQETRFAAPARGRYLCIETLGAHDGKNVAAIAELDGLDALAQVLSKATWKILWADSEEISAAPGEAGNILDGQPNTHWQTASAAAEPAFPHRVVIDLGETTTLGGIRYLPRAGGPNEAGRIKSYRVYVSDASFGFTAP
jgi:beta-galactosidase